MIRICGDRLGHGYYQPQKAGSEEKLRPSLKWPEASSIQKKLFDAYIELVGEIGGDSDKRLTF